MGTTAASPVPGRHQQFCSVQCRSGFQNIMYFCDTSALRGGRKGTADRTADIETGHAFKGDSPQQRGEGIPCHIRREAAGAAGARVSFLSGCLFQQALSLMFPASERRGAFLPSPSVPMPCCPRAGRWQQAHAAATSGLLMPSSHLAPNLDPLRVRNFY